MRDRRALAMTEERFRHLIEELGSENPLAIRPFLRIFEIRFTDEVPTLAVTVEERPSLLVNAGFLEAHCKSDDHVKAVVLHEYLHIVLRHTEKRGPTSAAEHLAMDAVINAIIHRQVGPAASSMMSQYYANETGMLRLLRPQSDQEIRQRATKPRDSFWSCWDGLYSGRLVVDDIRELAQELAPELEPVDVTARLLGGHDERSAGCNSVELSEEIKEALGDALRTMNGGGIWRAPFDRGVGVVEYETRVQSAAIAVERWKRTTMEILRRHVMPDARSFNTETRPDTYMLPVLSAGDRRAFVRAMWSPFLPEASWKTEIARRIGATQIYLDVSGSMNVETPHLIALLASLRRFIRMPFWAFSDEVAPAIIRNGALVTKTTGGTSIECVLKHIANTKPESAVIVTDGYIEAVDPQWTRDIGKTRIHAIVTRDGSTNLLDRARIGCTQLERVP